MGVPVPYLDTIVSVAFFFPLVFVLFVGTRHLISVQTTVLGRLLLSFTISSTNILFYHCIKNEEVLNEMSFFFAVYIRATIQKYELRSKPKLKKQLTSSCDWVLYT